MRTFMQVVDEEVSETGKLLVDFPWENAQKYAMWLAQTYQMVSHSTRLVALAGAWVEVSKSELHARFVDHSKEERGHEKICISDISNLGFRLQDFPALSQSLAMYQVQYYWIMFKGAESFFGYTLALESMAQRFGAQVLKMVNDHHDPKCNKFIKLHSEDDQEHIQRAYDQLNKLGDEKKQLVMENLSLSCSLYRSMLVEARRFEGVEGTKRVA